jgi:hypothetical protein
MHEFLFRGYSDHEERLVEVPVVKEDVAIKMLTLAILLCSHVENTADMTQAAHIVVVFHAATRLLQLNHHVQCYSLLMLRHLR